MPDNAQIRIMITGGGTGGHIYPAIAIADALKARLPGVQLLFVGAHGKMEMEKVPAAGYEIEGLPVAPLHRRLTLKNLLFPVKLLTSLVRSGQLIRRFHPDLVIGTGGFASGPVIRMAIRRKIPVLLQEQNSYPGITNRLVAGKTQRICVAYNGMERYFPQDKIVLTGNPVRKQLTAIDQKRAEGRARFSLPDDRPVILLFGGSLGARTINQTMAAHIEELAGKRISVIWQTGTDFASTAAAMVKSHNISYIKVLPFINEMELAYAAADLVVCRAGAITLSELAVTGKPAILVPYPHAAEDHQTKNARVFEAEQAALLVPDTEAPAILVDKMLELIGQPEKLRSMSRKMKYFARPNATRNITTEILNLLPESFNQHNLLIPRSLPRHCYFLGIGGIGMSALARYFRQNGVEVSGYDRIATPLTRRLEAEGMHIHYKDDPALIPPAFASPAQGDESLVVYTPAIPESHRERQRLIQLGYHLHKRSEILGMLSEQYRTLAVAGTHGKSTVSAMLAEIFRNSGTGCTAFLGAISKSIGSNYLYDAQAEWAVMEADEFDRSFLTLHPVQALVTSRDADHLDIYGTEEELQAAFNSFINRVTPGSVVILKKGVILTPDPVHRYRILSYALEDPDADYYAENLQVDEPGYKFDLVTPVATYRGWHTRIPGVLNVENSVAAAAMALEAGLYPGEVQKGLSVFDGLVRRLDIRFNRNNIIYMDDYAHHPNEIRALLHSVRALYPGRKITGIFQPHLFTRTRDFAAQFAAALEALDELLLLDIYPAREQPLPGITARIILDRIREIPAILVQKEQLPGILAEHTFDILLTIGAGDIDRLVEPITQYLEQHVT